MSELPRRSKRLRATAPSDGTDSDSSGSLYRFPNSDDEANDKCPICLQGVGASELGYPGECNHAFCLHCILKWAESSNTCPVDRTRFDRIVVRLIRGGVIDRVVPVDDHLDGSQPYPSYFPGMEEATRCEVCQGHGCMLDMLVCRFCHTGRHFSCCLNTNDNQLPPFEWRCPSCERRSDATIHNWLLRLERAHSNRIIPIMERALYHIVESQNRQTNVSPAIQRQHMLMEQREYYCRLRAYIIRDLPIVFHFTSYPRVIRQREDSPQSHALMRPEESQPSTSSGHTVRRVSRIKHVRGRRGHGGNAHNRQLGDNAQERAKMSNVIGSSSRSELVVPQSVQSVQSEQSEPHSVDGGESLVAAIARTVQYHARTAGKQTVITSAYTYYDLVGVLSHYVDIILGNKVDVMGTWPGEGCERVCAAGGGGGGGGDRRRGGGGGWGGGYRGGYSSHQHGPLHAQHYQDMYQRAPSAASSASPPPMEPPLRADEDKYDPTEPTRDESSSDEEEAEEAPTPVCDDPPPPSAALDLDYEGDCPNFSIYSATSVHIADEHRDEQPAAPVEQERHFDELERRISRRCPITPNVRTPIKIKLNTPTLAKRPMGLYDDEEMDELTDVADDALNDTAEAMDEELQDIEETSNHQEMMNNNQPDVNVAGPAHIDNENDNENDTKATSSISETEDSRSYTPCLDENKSKENSLEIEKENIGIEGLDTELISEDEGNELFSDGERCEKSPPSAGAPTEDGEIAEKRKGLADTSNKDEPKRKKKKENKKNAKEKKQKTKKSEVTFKKLSKNGKERNYRDKDERNNGYSSGDREKARRREKRKDLQRYDVRSLVSRRKTKDPFGRDVSPPHSPHERRRRARQSTSPLSPSPKLSPPTPPRRRSISRKRRKSISPKAKKSISPRPRRSISPRLRRSISPRLRRSISPKARRSISPLVGRSVSPRPKRSSSPGRLGLKRSISPRNRRSLSRPARKKSLSSPRRRATPARARRRLRRSLSRSPRPKPTKKKRRSRSRQAEKRSRKNKRKNNSPRRKSPKQKKKKPAKSVTPQSPALWNDTEERPLTWAPGSPGRTPPRRRDPPPSKEVFTSGDNILVSVSFDDEGRRRRRPRRDQLPPAKPVAIIDLDRSPFRELTPEPDTVIVLSDSSPSPRAASPPSVNNPPAAPAGPKTPPSPPSPAARASPAPAPAPEPAREAYDPFEPTKSPEPVAPAAAPILMTLETAQQTNMSADDVVNQRPVSPLEKVLALLQSTRDVAPAPTPYEPPTAAAASPAAPPEPVAQAESPYSPGSSDFGDLFSPPAVEGADAFDALFGPKRSATKTRLKTKRRSNKNEKAHVGVKMGDDDLKILDELPNSAVEMQVKSKFLKKLNRQERVVEEVKLVLKPHYNKKRLSKDEYKDILRRAVPKICHNKSGEINPTKIQALVEAYVRKFRKRRKLGLN